MRPLIALLLMSASVAAADIPDIRLEPLWPDLQFERPVCVVHANDGTPRLFVVEQHGRIWVVPAKRDAQKALFLDLRERVLTAGNEEGLLALAFHPKAKENGRLFCWFSEPNPRRNALAEYRVDAKNPDLGDPASEKMLLEIPDPYENHNGSSLLFGPDGMLYCGPGDGGAGGDPENRSQNLGELLGKVLRLDVDHQDPGRAYAVPKDNPFVGTAGARGEVWAYGVRNPWRMSFDRVTGELWAGDVGQNTWEEIDVIVKGGNYGWRVREGRHPFKADQTPTGSAPIEPVTDYGRDQGVSVTGGYVYRGKRVKGLQGVYLYADFATGRVWGLRYEQGQVTAQRQLLDSKLNISSFGELADGELVACAFDGKIYAVVPAK